MKKKLLILNKRSYAHAQSQLKVCVCIIWGGDTGIQMPGYAFSGDFVTQYFSFKKLEYLNVFKSGTCRNNWKKLNTNAKMMRRWRVIHSVQIWAYKANKELAVFPSSPHNTGTLFASLIST